MAPVSAQNAKDAADDFVARLRLPADLKGRKFQLVTFSSDEHCRFFYPRRAMEWQRQVNTYISRKLREQHGVRVNRIALTPEDYRIARAGGDIPDTQEDRYAFAEGHLHLLE